MGRSRIVERGLSGGLVLGPTWILFGELIYLGFVSMLRASKEKVRTRRIQSPSHTVRRTFHSN